MANIMKQNAPTNTAKEVYGLLERNRANIMRSMPAGFSFDRMCRTTMNAVYTNPAVAKCTSVSIAMAAAKAFAMGIEPNGVSGLGFFVPFWSAKKGLNEAQFMISWRGLCELARRSGEVLSIKAEVVCENDNFEYSAIDGVTRHDIDFRKARGNSYAYWARAVLKSGEVVCVCLGKEDVDKVRASSKSSESGPWVEWYDEMGKKTAVKRLCKWLPASVELDAAINNDDGAMGFDNGNVLDMDGLDFSVAEDEVKTESAPTENLKEKLIGKKTASASEAETAVDNAKQRSADLLG